MTFSIHRQYNSVTFLRYYSFDFNTLSFKLMIEQNVFQALEENQNGMPPTNTFVDLKALNPNAGVKPFHRLDPLPMNLGTEGWNSNALANDHGTVVLNPLGPQKQALPPVHGSKDQLTSFWKKCILVQ